VFPDGRGGNGGPPVERKVHRLEARGEVQGGVWDHEGLREGKDNGSLAVAGLFVGRAQAILRAASRLLYLQQVTMGGRHTSRDGREGGWESNVLVVHLQTLCQKLFVHRRGPVFGR